MGGASIEISASMASVLGGLSSSMTCGAVNKENNDLRFWEDFGRTLGGLWEEFGWNLGGLWEPQWKFQPQWPRF